MLHLLHSWRVSGIGRLKALGDSLVETEGGPGIVWYPDALFADFELRIRWRCTNPHDNSGVFLRLPELRTAHPDDWQPAIREAIEVQIDPRGFDPEASIEDSPKHRTGALYNLVAAQRGAERPVGEWNSFEIAAEGPLVTVTLNAVQVCQGSPPRRRLAGFIGLQTHHKGAAVQFADLEIRDLSNRRR